MLGLTSCQKLLHFVIHFKTSYLCSCIYQVGNIIFIANEKNIIKMLDISILAYNKKDISILAYNKNVSRYSDSNKQMIFSPAVSLVL